MRDRPVPSGAVLGPPAARQPRGGLNQYGYPEEIYDGGEDGETDVPAVLIGSGVPRHKQRDITAMAARYRGDRNRGTAPTQAARAPRAQLRPTAPAFQTAQPTMTGPLKVLGIDLVANTIVTSHGPIALPKSRVPFFRQNALEAIRMHFDQLVTDALAEPHEPTPASIVAGHTNASAGPLGDHRRSAFIDPFAVTEEDVDAPNGLDGAGAADTGREDLSAVSGDEGSDGVLEEDLES